MIVLNCVVAPSQHVPPARECRACLVAIALWGVRALPPDAAYFG